MTLAAIGRHFGVSQQRAYQLAKRGEEKLQRAHADLCERSLPERLQRHKWEHPISGWLLPLPPSRLLGRTLTYTPGSDMPEELTLPRGRR